MNTKIAIDILENEWEHLVSNYRYQNQQKLDCEELLHFCAEALKEKLAREHPKELSLEQLMSRAGCPVYFVPVSDFEAYGLLPCWQLSNNVYDYIKLHGLGWLYDSKPCDEDLVEQ